MRHSTLPADKAYLRSIVNRLGLDDWVYKEMGRLRTRRLLAYAKRRMLETGDRSLRCLEDEVLCEIYPSVENGARYSMWLLKKGTQLRQVLDAMTRDALEAAGLNDEYLAARLKDAIDESTGKDRVPGIKLAAGLLDASRRQAAPEERDYSAYLPSSSATDAAFEMIDEEEDVDVFAYLPDSEDSEASEYEEA